MVALGVARKTDGHNLAPIVSNPSLEISVAQSNTVPASAKIASRTRSASGSALGVANHEADAG